MALLSRSRVRRRVVAGIPKFQTLIDDASVAPNYTTKWAGTNSTMQAAITQTTGTYHIPPGSTGSTTFRELKTAFGAYVIEDSYVAVEMAGLPTGDGEVWMRVYLDGAANTGTRAQVYVSLGSSPTIHFGHSVATVSQGSATVAYSATTHRWWAIVHRETGGAGTFDWYTAQTPTAAPPQDGSAGPTNGWTRRWQDAAGVDPSTDQQLSIYQINDSSLPANSGDVVIAGVNVGW